MYNRKDMYKDYSDQSLIYYYDTIFNGDVKAMYEWSYGDTTPLSFVFKSEDCVEEKKIDITFYNFRYEVLYNINDYFYNLTDYAYVDYAIVDKSIVCGDDDPEDYTIQIVINSELSKTFKRGIYYCSLRLIDEEHDIVTTIIPPDLGLIYVR